MGGFSTMQSHRYQAVSLRRVIQASSANPELLQIKPKGFKSILQLTADFLETYQVTGTLLAKFPKGTLWQEDIQRYCQAMDGRTRLYSFSRVPEVAGHCGVSLPLESTHTWPGEYFLIVLSEAFSALLVVHRLQSASAVSPHPADENLEKLDPALEPPDGSANSSFYLEVCYSVNPDLIAGVVAAVKTEVEQLAPQYPDHEALQDLWQHWQEYCPVSAEGPAAMALLDRWLGWQLRQQEHLRQSVSAYRKQALAASNLSSQNEVLLNTLRLKDDFLNTVGQELRTPLTTIKTALTLLNSPSLKAPQRQRYLDMIAQECDRQRSLISGVLDLLQMETSLEHVRPQALQLADAVPPVVSTYQPLAEERGILLAYTIPNNLPTVSCPESWLRQIMIHLLNNSIKFTQSGGQVWVTTSVQDEFVELEIRDTGVGIAASELPNLFEHFYRGRNLPPGTPEGAGLGLSIVQQLLAYCGGSIVVHSQPGNGSSFRVRLPLHQT